MAPENEDFSEIDKVIKRFEKLFNDASWRKLMDECCDTLLLEDSGFEMDLEEIRSDPKFKVPLVLTPEMDSITMADKHEEHHRLVDIFVYEYLPLLRHPEALIDEMKSYFEDVIHHMESGVQLESVYDYYGLFLGDMSEKNRELFDEAIRKLLRKRELSPLFFGWVKWLVLYRTENKSLRPHYFIYGSLGFDVVANLKDVKNFRLTTQQKKDIYNEAKSLLNLSPNKHFPKPAKKELKWIFAQSKGGDIKPSRKKLELDTVDYEKRDKLPIEEQEHEERKDADRIRQRKRRDKGRVAKLTRKKSKS